MRKSSHPLLRICSGERCMVTLELYGRGRGSRERGPVTIKAQAPRVALYMDTVLTLFPPPDMVAALEMPPLGSSHTLMAQWTPSTR